MATPCSLLVKRVEVSGIINYSIYIIIFTKSYLNHLIHYVITLVPFVVCLQFLQQGFGVPGFSRSETDATSKSFFLAPSFRAALIALGSAQFPASSAHAPVTSRACSKCGHSLAAHVLVSTGDCRFRQCRSFLSSCPGQRRRHRSNGQALDLLSFGFHVGQICLWRFAWLHPVRFMFPASSNNNSADMDFSLPLAPSPFDPVTCGFDVLIPRRSRGFLRPSRSTSVRGSSW